LRKKKLELKIVQKEWLQLGHRQLNYKLRVTLELLRCFFINRALEPGVGGGAECIHVLLGFLHAATARRLSVYYHAYQLESKLMAEIPECMMPHAHPKLQSCVLVTCKM
jgi:hypothetical protein